MEKTTMDTMKQHSLNRFYSGAIDDKLLLLEELYVRYARDMLDDKKVCASLDLLHYGGNWRGNY